MYIILLPDVTCIEIDQSMNQSIKQPTNQPTGSRQQRQTRMQRAYGW